MSWADTVLADRFSGAHSPVESDRFGLGISRAVVPMGIGPGQGYDEANAFIESSDDDVVVLRYPADRSRWFADLRSTGRDIIFADSLIYWQMKVRPEVLPVDPRLTIKHGTDLPLDVVGDFIEAMFRGYPNHYAANPLLDPQASLDGYREWAAKLVSNQGVITLAVDEMPLAGLAITETVDSHTEVVLAGVEPELRGMGLYAALFAECEVVAREAGSTDMVTSTQAPNTHGARAWTRFGLAPVAAFTTIHLVRAGLLDQV